MHQGGGGVRSGTGPRASQNGRMGDAECEQKRGGNVLERGPLIRRGSGVVELAWGGCIGGQWYMVSLLVGTATPT